MGKKARFSPPAVGGSSLLVIFAILCLTVFTLLSLSTVQAQRRLADASMQAVTDYYKADVEAEEIFARLRSGEAVGGVQQTGSQYRYSCPISPRQKLQVVLEVEQGEWSVLCWQAVADGEITANDSPAVWEGL